MSNEYKEWLKEQTFESLANDNLRIKLELKTAKEENERLEEANLTNIGNLTENIEFLTNKINEKIQQNKQMLEYIEKAEDIARTYQDYRPCLLIKKELQQALKEVNNEK